MRRVHDEPAKPVARPFPLRRVFAKGREAHDLLVVHRGDRAACPKRRPGMITTAARPDRAAQTARNQRPYPILPVSVAIQPTMYGPMKPPRFPMLLMTARPAAAPSPLR